MRLLLILSVFAFLMHAPVAAQQAWKESFAEAADRLGETPTCAGALDVFEAMDGAVFKFLQSQSEERLRSRLPHQGFQQLVRKLGNPWQRMRLTCTRLPDVPESARLACGYHIFNDYPRTETAVNALRVLARSPAGTWSIAASSDERAEEFDQRTLPAFRGPVPICIFQVDPYGPTSGPDGSVIFQTGVVLPTGRVAGGLSWRWTPGSETLSPVEQSFYCEDFVCGEREP